MFSRFFIDRPIFATVISVVITLAGGVAVWSLPIAQYPEVTPPTVQVTAFYPGANALTVQDTVAAPIEEQVSGVEGMAYMSSRSTNDGAYNLTVTFKLGTDSDMAQVLVQNRVSLALPVIPALVQRQGINVRKVSPSTLMIVNLISPDGRYDALFLSNYATIELRDELGRLPGVGGVGYLGQRNYSLRVWLDPDKLASLNLTPQDVLTAIGQQNIQVAAGSVALSIYQLPGSNALQTARGVYAKMDELKQRFPEGVDYEIVYDTTPFISESIAEVFRTLRDAIILVAIVVLAFLQNWRAALIPLVAVPVAIVGTFVVMAALGYSLNNLSLFGLVLAIGIVVDDAIVVVENVERWLEQGAQPREAARRAMDEVTGPVIAVALVLCAVFVPCTFLGGVSGQFFRQFAVTISVSTVISAFNSLTLSPALAAILLKPHAARPDPPSRVLNFVLGWFFRGFNWVFGASTAGYGWLVSRLLRGS